MVIFRCFSSPIPNSSLLLELIISEGCLFRLLFHLILIMFGWNRSSILSNSFASGTAEAVALKEAILFIKKQRLQPCPFLTDNQELAKVCMGIHPPFEAHWRACREVNEIWKLASCSRKMSLTVGTSHDAKMDWVIA